MLGKLFSRKKNVSEAIVNEFDPSALIAQLDPRMRRMSEIFYSQYCKMLPETFAMDYDERAPKNVNAQGTGDKTKISLALKFLHNQARYKYGTGRTELRGDYFFAKTVTWRTPKDFLHQRKVYDRIKSTYTKAQISHCRSQSGRGFSIKDSSQLVTLEVFGDNPRSSFLACDITLSMRNLGLVQDRVVRFLEFFGELYNEVEDQHLNFKTGDAGLASLQFIDSQIPTVHDRPMF